MTTTTTTVTPTREKLKEVRSKISKKSKEVTIISDDKMEIIPMESFWQEFQGLEIKEIEVDCKDSLMATIKAKKGTVLDIHYHLRKEVVYVVSGKIRESMSNEKVLRGNTITFDKKQKHGIEFLEDTVLMVHWIN